MGYPFGNGLQENRSLHLRKRHRRQRQPDCRREILSVAKRRPLHFACDRFSLVPIRQHGTDSLHSRPEKQLRKMKPAHNPMSRPLLLVFEAHSTAERALNKAIYPFLLRRSKPLRELALSSGERPSRRSCALRYSSSSCEGMFAGAEHADAGCPPTNEGSSEVRIPPSRACSGEANLNRSWETTRLHARLRSAHAPNRLPLF